MTMLFRECPRPGSVAWPSRWPRRAWPSTGNVTRVPVSCGPLPEPAPRGSKTIHAVKCAPWRTIAGRVKFSCLVFSSSLASSRQQDLASHKKLAEVGAKACSGTGAVTHLYRVAAQGRDDKRPAYPRAVLHVSEFGTIDGLAPAGKPDEIQRRPGR